MRLVVRATRAASQLRRQPISAFVGLGSPRFIAAPMSSRFSTYRPLLRPSDGTSPPPPKKLDRFEELGISKNMKIVLFVILSILGTVETFVWTKGILRWYYGPGVSEEDTPVASE
ncbi:hypothetical protein B0H13DRAFT_283525 [Mycena leptocephala]|nr:hypothetical protein B0H13DRAFT_283525 [Mycena leptocephala]